MRLYELVHGLKALQCKHSLPVGCRGELLGIVLLTLGQPNLPNMLRPRVVGCYCPAFVRLTDPGVK